MNDDLVLDTNIIPVITIDSGSPMVERPPTYSLSLDNIKPSCNKIDDRESRGSDKSSLFDTSHKVFEKISGSLTAWSRSIRDSLEFGDENDENELEKLGKSPVEYDIDVMALSPGNKFIATWSSTDGILAVFPIDSQNVPMESTFGIKTPYNKITASQDQYKIYISVSEDGQYVAISTMTIMKDNQKDSPNMDAENSDISKSAINTQSQSSFVVYSTIHKTENYNNKLGKLNSMDILGPLIFVNNQRLVCFTESEMHLFYTKSWRLHGSSIDISALIHSCPKYSDDDNEYLLYTYDILIESLKYGYLIWPENLSGLSVWDTDGMLKQWFYIEAKNISYSRNLFAISSDGNLVARFYEEQNNKPGGTSSSLNLFHTPTALAVSEFEVSRTTFHISFLPKTDHIIVCSKEGEGVCVQLWHCWAGCLVFEEKFHNLKHDKPLLFLGDKFVQAVGNELCTYSLIPNHSSATMEALTITTSQGCKSSEDGLLITLYFETQISKVICWGRIYNSDQVLQCTFKVEPWHNWCSKDIFVRWLDPEGKRFVLVGIDSVQIYKTKPKGQYLKLELQYIWVTNSCIKSVILETSLDENDQSNPPQHTMLHVQFKDNEPTSLPIPNENDKLTHRIASDACAAVHYLRMIFTPNIQVFNQLAIRDQLRKLIDSSVIHFPSVFNKCYWEGIEFYPMEDFIMLSWDDLVKSILKTDRFIPLFHDKEQTESALLLLIELQKSELVEQMVNYIMKHLKQRYVAIRNRSNSTNLDKKVQQPGFAWTLGKSLLELFQYYPDKGIFVMKESSYFTVSLEAPSRILQTDLSYGEERSWHKELKAVARIARLPKGISFPDDNQGSIMSKLFRPSSLNIKMRHHTGALVYHPNETRYYAHGTEKKDLNKEIYMQLKQRKQRLEDVKKTHPAKLCVVPLPDFCVYPRLPIKDSSSSSSLSNIMHRFWYIYFAPAQRSPFADVALNGPAEMFSEVAMEAIIKFKWEKFAKRLYLWQFSFYIIFGITFCLTVSIESTQDGRSNSKFIVATIISMMFLLQEIRQMTCGMKNYWTSFFNYVDLASYCLPLATSLTVLMKVEPPIWLIGFAVLCVWLNGLLKSRAFEATGKFIAIVIVVGKRIKTLLMTLFIIVLGFSNAMYILLREKDPAGLVPKFSGTVTDNLGNSALIEMNQIPDKNTNMWQRFDYSILATYFFLGIGWDSVSGFDPDWSLYIMMILFSLVTVIMLLNILIGLITEVFSGSLQVGRQAWLRQRAELVAELEILMLSPSHRQYPDWFPHLIYYEAHVDSIKNWKRKLELEEMGELDVDFVKRELKSVRDDLNNEIKELKGMVGQIRIFIIGSKGDADSGSRSNRNSLTSI
ncbi:4418_t:CDS:2 [Funneliformis geosporum]|uniref:17601_t:CDS:1 n=1 Tax=Funneliformis geosporum TaxID=1117311 RepID=A0A9W4WKA3_9GLOM|nr:17601_t:CDS:2 [Funneliformis geosporum]CAI2168268.1 4418_t:CDS:2 [Funneliformis geosporum]